MPDLNKLLSKFNKKERKLLELLVEKIISFKWRGLNIKKLKGHQDIYRVRKGNLRIIFRTKNKIIFILAIERRTEKTYKI
ncbi:MAG: type II toxin-antitoxin system RelE/ParE family toxin [Patescibacteria group bacterium]